MIPGCLAVTACAGPTACTAAGGAAACAVTNLRASNNAHTQTFTWKPLAIDTAVGAVVGAATGAPRKVAAPLLSKAGTGDQVRQTDGTPLTVQTTRIYDADLTAYNLTVDDIHTYYAGTTPVLVHNSCYEEAAEAAGSGLPGVGDVPTKVVNSNMGHINAERAARAGFENIRGAQAAVRDLGKSIESSGFPEGKIPDSVRADRLLAPIGDDGYAVYQIMRNGNAVFKTILRARP